MGTAFVSLLLRRGTDIGIVLGTQLEATDPKEKTGCLVAARNLLEHSGAFASLNDDATIASLANVSYRRPPPK